MPTAFEKLIKILKLEQEQGYQNRAVIGGLEKFAEVWAQEARSEAHDTMLANQIDKIGDQLRQYAGETEDQ
ncbi:MAG: hypothetical protein PVI68_10510, partial [Anaerolineae bacterium]